MNKCILFYVQYYFSTSSTIDLISIDLSFVSKKKNKKYFNWKTDRKNKNEEEEVKKNPIIKWHVFNLSISLIKSILATNTHNICRWFFFIAFMLITKIYPTFCHGYYK